MTTFRAGFHAGEFGHILFRWQGILRHLAQGYKEEGDKVVIGTEKQYQFLYEDFATEFVDFPYKIESRDMWMTNNRIYRMANPVKNMLPAFAPYRQLTFKEDLPQTFIKWGKKITGLEIDILIHARATNNKNTGFRNWPKEKWQGFVDLNKGKYNMACIGTIDGAYKIDGITDYRGYPLKALADIMASSKMLLSPSSGPAHFASLCGLKHIVWSELKNAGLYNNIHRYKKMWNPFKTECKFIVTWQPTVKQVCEEVEKWV